MIVPLKLSLLLGEYPNKLQRSLKKDANEPGWASGVDDLARVLLDNKSDIKFNKRLMTKDGTLQPKLTF